MFEVFFVLLMRASETSLVMHRDSLNDFKFNPFFPLFPCVFYLKCTTIFFTTTAWD